MSDWVETAATSSGVGAALFAGGFCFIGLTATNLIIGFVAILASWTLPEHPHGPVEDTFYVLFIGALVWARWFWGASPVRRITAAKELWFRPAWVLAGWMLPTPVVALAAGCPR